MGKRPVVPGGWTAPAEPAQPGQGRPHHRPQGPHVKVPPRSFPLASEKTHGQQLKDAWCDFLAPYRFQWFATLTFAENVHPESAIKRFRRFTNEINRHLYGRRWEKTSHGGLFWIVALERQKRGVIHFHALVGAIDDLNEVARRLDWMDRWAELAGYARIEAIRSNDAVRRYVTKYVVKGGDIEFSKNLHWSQQPRLLDQ